MGNIMIQYKIKDKMNSIMLEPKLEELYVLNTFIEKIIMKRDFQLDLIVEEVFVNIVNYSQCNFINVKTKFKNNIFTIEFIDDGMKFNPLLKKDHEFPDSIDDAPIGGLGIYLSTQLSDSVDYFYINGENHFKIKKNIM